MKHKVSELEGALLDLAVAIADGYDVLAIPPDQFEHAIWTLRGQHDPVPRYIGTAGRYVWINEHAQAWRFAPSVAWDHGGPIIERERISINFDTEDYTTPEAPWYAECRVFWDIGPTPLIAAMRCYVASKLGEEIELP